MTNKWKISGLDTWSTYGTVILKNSYLDIMTPPTPRRRLEYEYPDANGTKVDVVSPISFEARRYKLNILIVGNSYAQFWTNYNALLGAIAKAGTFTLYIADLGVTVTLLYEGMPCVSKPRSLRIGRIAVAYELNVFELNPANRTYGA